MDLCLAVFKKVPGLAYTVVVTQRDYVFEAAGLVLKAGLPGVVTVGGEQREDSVKRGLEVIPPGVMYVLVHDAARPFVPVSVVTAVLKETKKSGAAIPVMPVKDTLKMVVGNQVVKTLDRATLRAVQTPQGFRTELLKKAFQKLGSKASSMTDDAAVFEAVGGRVKVVDGDAVNFKVTTPDDLQKARELLKKKG